MQCWAGWLPTAQAYVGVLESPLWTAGSHVFAFKMFDPISLTPSLDTTPGPQYKAEKQ